MPRLLGGRRYLVIRNLCAAQTTETTLTQRRIRSKKKQPARGGKSSLGLIKSWSASAGEQSWKARAPAKERRVGKARGSEMEARAALLPPAALTRARKFAINFTPFLDPPLLPLQPLFCYFLNKSSTSRGTRRDRASDICPGAARRF